MLIKVLLIKKTCIRFNQDSHLLLKSQMKSNRFAVADKQTNIVEANHEIKRNSFAKPNYDPTKEFILKLKQWVYKWVFKN